MTDNPIDANTLQMLLDRLASGDEKAAENLIEYASDRLRRMIRKQLQGDRRVHRWEATDDVLQNALMRLYRALKKVKPATERHFINLAAKQIRYELYDLARRHFGPHGDVRHHLSDPPGNNSRSPLHPRHELAADTDSGPTTELRHAEFHEQVDKMPEEEREVFGLIFYLGLEQSEVAKRLEISVPTVKRRWSKARRFLGEVLGEGGGLA